MVNQLNNLKVVEGGDVAVTCIPQILRQLNDEGI